MSARPKSGGHVFVDYAHTPDGLGRAVARGASACAGAYASACSAAAAIATTTKRPKMGAIAARQADVVIVTDDNPRSEEPAAIRKPRFSQSGRPQSKSAIAPTAIREAVSMLKPGDALMIAGKGQGLGKSSKA